MQNISPDTEISFIDPSIQEDPYEAYQYLLENEPVYCDPRSGFYVLTRYEDIRRVLTDPATFSSEGYLELLRSRLDPEREQRMRSVFEENGWLPGNSLGTLDEPRHGEVRAIFETAFRASRIKELDPVVEELALELVMSFAEDGECEFVDQFAVPLPLIVIGIQMGARREDMRKIKAWTDAWIQRLGMMQTEEEERYSIEMECEAQNYFKPIMDELRRSPNNTVMSTLVNTPTSDGNLLTDNEIFSHLMADSFVGGAETTTNTLSTGMKILCENPEQYSQLISNPEEHLRTFVEEILRVDSSVQGVSRLVTKDVYFHGRLIPAGSILNCRTAAANHDPRQFECPATLDLKRKNAGSHMSFGSGIHHCLGAPLARRELYWSFKALLENLQNIRLAPGKNDLKHHPNFMLRALRALHIEFDIRR